MKLFDPNVWYALAHIPSNSEFALGRSKDVENSRFAVLLSATNKSSSFQQWQILTFPSTGKGESYYLLRSSLLPAINCLEAYCNTWDNCPENSLSGLRTLATLDEPAENLRWIVEETESGAVQIRNAANETEWTLGTEEDAIHITNTSETWAVIPVSAINDDRFSTSVSAGVRSHSFH